MALFGNSYMVIPPFSYTDSSGNTFIISSVPGNIDTTFLKSELTSSYFLGEEADQSMKYHLFVSEFTPSGKNSFKMKVHVDAQIQNEQDMKEVLRFQGYSHYTLKTRKKKGITKIKSVVFDYGEV